MTIVTRVRRLGYGCLALTLASCGDEPTEPPLERGEPNRTWTFGTYPRNHTVVDNGPRHTQEGGTVNDFHDYGRLFMTINGDSTATGEVFSSADGATYYVSAQGYPSGAPGNKVTLTQFQTFRKRAADASLKFTVTGVVLDAANFNSDPVPRSCTDGGANCLNISARTSLEIKAWKDTGEVRTLFWGGSAVIMEQRANKWDHVTMGPPDPSANYLWFPSDFVPDFAPKSLALSGRLTLARPLTFAVDLSRVAIDEQFTVRTVAIAETYNLTGRESYVFAYLRDPASIGGTTVEIAGLEPTGPAIPEPPLGDFGVAPPCTAESGGSGGTLQFSRSEFRADELPVGGPEQVTVTRTGGSSGAVSATITTSNGTASEGADYTAVAATVAFGDGDTASRVIDVPLVLDTIAEPDKTVNVTLSDPRGCASLGAAAAVLTIVDDDRPPTAEAFAVGGTVTGLAGSGLVLRNATGGEELAVAADGPFTFRLLTPTGIDYDVLVATQPTSPAQLCTVANGTGTMADTAVTNVAVECVTPTNGGLDPAFGGDGVVQTPLSGARGGAVAVQPDGKVVVAGYAEVGSTDDFALTRYNADGSLDATFGAGGTVTTGFAADSRDEGLDVAVQVDGKIVVAGRTAAATGDHFFDFAVARYNADGSLDASFGGDGTVTTDVGASGQASARAVVVQPDGRILVAGDAEVGRGSDFALARYNADGTLDATFGTGGITTADFTTGDAGHDVALMADGRIVVAGAAATGIEKDFAVARFNADGSVDRSFGTNGHATANIGGVDEAFGVVVAPDGGIVAAGSIDALPGAIGIDFALARFNPDGSLDAGFGSGGTVTTNFTAGRDRGAALARQADGKLVVVGLTTSESFAFNNFALARYDVDGSLDASFGLGGRLTVDVGGGHSAAAGIAIQADGKVVVAGIASHGADPGFAVVRALP